MYEIGNIFVIFFKKSFTLQDEHILAFIYVLYIEYISKINFKNFLIIINIIICKYLIVIILHRFSLKYSKVFLFCIKAKIYRRKV